MDRAINEATGVLLKREGEERRSRQACDEVVALCGKSMQLMHASRMAEAKKILDDAKRRLKKVAGKANCTVAQQEYVEAVALACFMEGTRVAGYTKLGVGPDAYLLGLADTIGELRREIVEHMRKDDYKTATRLFEEMSSLYELLLPIRLSNAVLPGFRRKLDVARSMVEQCRRDLLMYKVSKGMGER